MYLKVTPGTKSLLLKGNFGVERESLRIDAEGRMAHTLHPFPQEGHIVRDFCENQTEINTSVLHSPEDAVAELGRYHREILRKLSTLGQREWLWPFSSPPPVADEDDIPVAQFEGERRGKTIYRHHLSDRHGKRKMAFCGIHVNYSFPDELVRAAAAEFGVDDVRAFSDALYLNLAARSVMHGWLLTALTAASPLLDSSFFEDGNMGQDAFVGKSSVRCSELGYWNAFTPVLNYQDLSAYAASIREYVFSGLLLAPTELYYPIRLKPRGMNSLEALEKNGADHIELRMFDLNPYAEAGLDVRDLRFAQLFLVYLASGYAEPFGAAEQVRAVQNFKNAATFDLDSAKILGEDGRARPATEAALELLGKIRSFFAGFSGEAREALDWQEEKLRDKTKRYAFRVRRDFAGTFAEKGLALAKEKGNVTNV